MPLEKYRLKGTRAAVSKAEVGKTMTSVIVPAAARLDGHDVVQV